MPHHSPLFLDSFVDSSLQIDRVDAGGVRPGLVCPKSVRIVWQQVDVRTMRAQAREKAKDVF